MSLKTLADRQLYQKKPPIPEKTISGASLVLRQRTSGSECMGWPADKQAEISRHQFYAVWI